MKTMMQKPVDTDTYIAGYPKETQKNLKLLRATIKKAAPQAEEIISYGMPAYKWNGMLVYFAAYEKHIGFYPGSSGIAAFKNELASYKTSKGTVQFPVEEPVPLPLIARIVKFRLKENQEKALLKSMKK
jgi:uncharacterized protein YdhG (YjbR/CyaY superfamily)